MADTMTTSSASATMHTYLLYKDGNAYKKLVDIKDFPAMGGSPEQIESTTLSNEKSTFVTGVQSVSTFEFLANYTADDFDRLSAMQAEAQVKEFVLAFGKPTSETTYGSLGVFKWEGQISVWLEGGGVNAVREMRISISATKEVSFSKTTVTVTA
jgi:hypothetical protein